MKKIAVIGQGYVGLPLAISFARLFPVVGFDIDAERVDQLNNGLDRTSGFAFDELNEVLVKDGAAAFETGYSASSSVEDIADAHIYIITVPTPVDKYNAPDLCKLLHASRIVGSVLCDGDIVIYESTVYPGCTEEDCVPVLEHTSGLTFNRDFFVGYSPERINPGDKVNTLKTIVKVTSGSTADTAQEIDALYRRIVEAGTHLAPSIKVAEASKAIENAQRDVNISFVNELSLIFDRMGIDTQDVLDAAGTKFNFLKYQPGLVGGHCISVDPYYLTHKATALGYYPDVIMSGRRVNDSMAKFIATKTVKLLINKGVTIKGGQALILGVTFKENFPDVRNTKVAAIFDELRDFGMHVDVYDPIADPQIVKKELGMTLLSSLATKVTSKTNGLALETLVNGTGLYSNEGYEEHASSKTYDAIILAVPHKELLELEFDKLRKKNAVLFDVKSALPRAYVDARL